MRPASSGSVDGRQSRERRPSWRARFLVPGIWLSDRRRTPLYIEVIDPQHCTPEVRRQILTEVSFFSDLKPAELEAVDRRARSVGFTAGDWVYREGEPASQLFVIATGVVKTTRLSAEGIHTTT